MQTDVQLHKEGPWLLVDGEVAREGFQRGMKTLRRVMDTFTELVVVIVL